MPEVKIVGRGGDFAQAPESHHCAGASLFGSVLCYELACVKGW
jgi:hypothetical protein